MDEKSTILDIKIETLQTIIEANHSVLKMYLEDIQRQLDRIEDKLT